MVQQQSNIMLKFTESQISKVLFFITSLVRTLRILTAESVANVAYAHYSCCTMLQTVCRCDS